MPGNGRREEERNGIERDEVEEEFEVEEVRERLESSRGSRFILLNKELRGESFRRKFSREGVINGFRDLSKGMVIYPDHNRYFSLSPSKKPRTATIHTGRTELALALANNNYAYVAPTTWNLS